MSDDEDDDRAPRQLGAPRKEVLVVCCPNCGSIDVARTHSKGPIAYWSCSHCSCTWKESATVGLHRAKLA